MPTAKIKHQLILITKSNDIASKFENILANFWINFVLSPKLSRFASSISLRLVYIHLEITFHCSDNIISFIIPSKSSKFRSLAIALASSAASLFFHSSFMDVSKGILGTEADFFRGSFEWTKGLFCGF